MNSGLKLSFALQNNDLIVGSWKRHTRRNRINDYIARKPDFGLKYVNQIRKVFMSTNFQLYIAAMIAPIEIGHHYTCT